MDGYTTEQEQIEAIKKWWNENGKAIVFGLVLGVGGLFGYRYWEQTQISQGHAASINYEHLLRIASAGSSSEVTEAGDAIIQAYPKSTYAKLSALVLAKLAVDVSDFDEAKTRLQWVIDRSAKGKLKPVALARLAQVYLAVGDVELAATSIGQIEPKYGNEFSEVRGDVFLAQGQIDQARAMYSAALAEAQERGRLAENLELKLDNLGLAAE